MTSNSEAVRKMARMNENCAAAIEIYRSGGARLKEVESLMLRQLRIGRRDARAEMLVSTSPIPIDVTVQKISTLPVERDCQTPFARVRTSKTLGLNKLFSNIERPLNRGMLASPTHISRL